MQALLSIFIKVFQGICFWWTLSYTPIIFSRIYKRLETMYPLYYSRHVWMLVTLNFKAHTLTKVRKFNGIFNKRIIIKPIVLFSEYLSSISIQKVQVQSISTERLLSYWKKYDNSRRINLQFLLQNIIYLKFQLNWIFLH